MNKEEMLAEVGKWLLENDFLETFHAFTKRPDAASRFITLIGWAFEDEFILKCHSLGILCEKAHTGLRHDCLVDDKQKTQCKLTGYTDRVDLRSKEKKNRRYRIDEIDNFVIKIIKRPSSDYYIIPIKKAEQLWDKNRPGYIKAGIGVDKIVEYKDAWHTLTLNN